MSASGIRLGQVDTELPAPAALADATANPTTPLVGAAGLVLGVGSAWDRARSVTLLGDASTQGLPAAGLYNFTGGAWDRQRTPNVFKHNSASAAGSTALWTPAAGKKFRLLRALIYLNGAATLAAGGTLNVNLLDAAADAGVAFGVFVPGAGANTVAGGLVIGPIDLGNGYLSAAANNVLNINLGAALTAGLINVWAAGTEE